MKPSEFVSGIRVNPIIAAIAFMLLQLSWPATAAAILTATLNAGGQRAVSSRYSVDGCLNGFGAMSTARVGAVAVRTGYAGQLYDVKRLQLSASPTAVNETSNTQFSALAVMDDSTLLPLPAGSVSWSGSWPITSISVEGSASTTNIYQDTVVAVGAVYQSISGSFNLTVLNVGADDFGLYAGDGIPDAWQVLYFGTNNLAATTATARFQYVAGLNPTNPASIFSLSLSSVSGVPAVVFSPCYTNRTYVIQYATNFAAGAFQTLTGGIQEDSGVTRTVTDPEATNESRFYRVQISF